MREAYRTKLFQLGTFVLVRVGILVVVFSNILKINQYLDVSGQRKWIIMKSIHLSCFTDFSEGVNSVGKVSFRSTFSIKDLGQPSILVTSLSEEEPAI